MSGARSPQVAGVAGGVGTSVVAAALRAIDAGVYSGGPVDIVVCTSTVHSVGLAHEVLARVPYPPVLAVVADGPSGFKRPSVRARVRMAEAHAHALIRVPYFEGLRCVEDPYAGAGLVLCADAAELDKDVRPFAQATHQLAAAVTPLVTRASAPAGHQDGARSSALDVFAGRRSRSIWPVAP